MEPPIFQSLLIIIIFIVGLYFLLKNVFKKGFEAYYLEDLAKELNINYYSNVTGEGSKSSMDINSTSASGEYKGRPVSIYFVEEISYSIDADGHRSESRSVDTFIKVKLNHVLGYEYTIDTGLYNLRGSDPHYNIHSNDTNFVKHYLPEAVDSALIKSYDVLINSTITIAEDTITYESMKHLHVKKHIAEFKQIVALLVYIAQPFEHYFSFEKEQFASFTDISTNYLGLTLIENKNKYPMEEYIKSLQQCPILLFYGKTENEQSLQASLRINGNVFMGRIELQLNRNYTHDIELTTDDKKGLGKLFKGQDIKIRDEEFDKAFIIKSKDSLLVKQLLLNQQLRGALLAMKSYFIRLEIKNNKIIFETTAFAVSGNEQELKTLLDICLSLEQTF